LLSNCLLRSGLSSPDIHLVLRLHLAERLENIPQSSCGLTKAYLLNLVFFLSELRLSVVLASELCKLQEVAHAARSRRLASNDK